MKSRAQSAWVVSFVLLCTFALLAPACGGGGGTGDDDVDVGEIGDTTGDEPIDDDGSVEDGREDARDDGAEVGDDGTGDDGDVPPTCGDGVLDPGEDCDDGNDVPGDGCEFDCTFSCSDSTECDDLDACNGVETCTDHACLGGSPPPDGTPCWLDTGDAGACRVGTCVSANCGNGVVDTGEECDDGNVDDTDACLTRCRAATCGDGRVWSGVEACDDGNTVSGDGCEADCTVSCTTDGDCDDGEPCNGPEVCDAMHACAAGTPAADGTPCTLASGGAGACRGGLCSSTACGNGTVDPGEACDDGNTDNTDACLTSCAAASCGDSYIWTGMEDCDSVPPRTCTAACGTTGLQACDTTCHWETICTPPAEVCNGVDDDCDGAPDNGFACAPTTTQGCATSCGSTGSQTCSSACAWGACTPPAEVCNGADDDCDGVADNGFACAPSSTQTCTTSCGTTGLATCTSACAWGACTPPAEVCNGADDDCDGAADEGFACVRGAAGRCTTACGSTGSQTCDATCAWGACVPPAEICNGTDDDCDGAADEGFACVRGAPTTCTTTCGSTGVGTCSATCTTPTGPACTPPVETCNGADDDCDTLIDDGFACAAGATRPCSVGTCAGTQTCSSGCTWGACAVPVPVNDTCAGAVLIVPGRDPVGTTCGAAEDYTPTCGGASTAGRDVVYRLDITSRSAVVLDTDGATWDTILHLHSGAACPGTEVACNDDIGGGNLASRISSTLDPGTYWVVVDGYNAGASGPFTLHVSVMGAGDECATAIPLTLTAARTTVTGTTATASPSVGSCDTGNDLWFVFRLTQRERVLINTYGSAFDTLLALTTGCGAIVPACTNDSCGGAQTEIVQTLDPGTYYVLLDGRGTASGSYTLNLEHLPVAQDGTARALGAGASTMTGTTALPGNGLVNGTCGGVSTSSEHSFFWTTCPGGTGGTFTGTTCVAGTVYDTIVYLRSGGTGTDIACNDDGSSVACGVTASEITGAVPAGAGLFGFYIDGYAGAEGNYAAAVTRP